MNKQNSMNSYIYNTSGELYQIDENHKEDKIEENFSNSKYEINTNSFDHKKLFYIVNLIFKASEKGSFEIIDNDGYPYILIKKNTKFKFIDDVDASVYLIGGGGAGSSSWNQDVKEGKKGWKSIIGGGGGGGSTNIQKKVKFKKDDNYQAFVGKGGIAETKYMSYKGHVMNKNKINGSNTQIKKEGKLLYTAEGGKGAKDIIVDKEEDVDSSALGGSGGKINGKYSGGDGGRGGGYNFNNIQISSKKGSDSNDNTRFKIGRKEFQYGGGGSGGWGWPSNTDFKFGYSGKFGKGGEENYEHNIHLHKNVERGGYKKITELDINDSPASSYRFNDNFGAGGGGHLSSKEVPSWAGNGNDGAIFIAINSIKNGKYFKNPKNFLDVIEKRFLYKFDLNNGNPYFIFDNNKEIFQSDKEIEINVTNKMDVKFYAIAGGGAGMQGNKSKIGKIGGSGGGGGETKISKIIKLKKGDKISLTIGKKRSF